MFPNSNLPTASQQWGKEVVKRIEATEVTVARNETNNLTRDSQLNSAMLAANAAINGLKAADAEILAVALQAQTAADDASAAAILAQAAADDALEALGAIGALEDNIYVPGTTEINGTSIKTGTFSADKITTGALNASLITVGTLTADRISGGTLNGGIVQITNLNATNITSGSLSADRISGGTITGTVAIIGASISSAASGARIGISGTTLTVYGASGTVASIYGGASGLLISGVGGSFSTTASGASIEGGANSIDVLSTGIIVSGSTVFSDRVDFDAILSVTGDADFIDATFTGTVNLNGTTNTTGITNSGGGISSTGTISTNGGLVRTVYAGGGTTGASFDNNGTVIRTTSSERYKQDISSLSFSYEDLLSLEPKKFRLKNEVAEDANAREYAGFIAEEIAGTSLDIFVSYQPTEDGGKRPDGVYYGELTAALLYALKQQDAAIKALSGRIEVLENN